MTEALPNLDNSPSVNCVVHDSFQTAKLLTFPQRKYELNRQTLTYYENFLKLTPTFETPAKAQRHHKLSLAACLH